MSGTKWSKFHVKGNGFQTFAGTTDVYSNWHPSVFTMTFDGVAYTFCSSEQALMFEKARVFGDKDVMAKIIAAKDQDIIKQLGREVKNFNEKFWTENRQQIMINILVQKFGQNPEMLKVLLASGDDVLIEASPWDKIWGIGKGPVGVTADPSTWSGTNILGYSLMEARALLRKTIVSQ